MRQLLKKKNTLIKRSTAEKVLFAFVLVFFCVYALMLIYPVVWGFSSSFKTIDDYFDNRFGLPVKWIFENYPKDEILCGLIPNGKFVKIEENNKDCGVIKDAATNEVVITRDSDEFKNFHGTANANIKNTGSNIAPT